MDARRLCHAALTLQQLQTIIVEERPELAAWRERLGISLIRRGSAVYPSGCALPHSLPRPRVRVSTLHVWSCFRFGRVFSTRYGLGLWLYRAPSWTVSLTGVLVRKTARGEYRCRVV